MALRVLVADDDEIAAELLANFLRSSGYDVTLAKNGREAFQLVRTGEYRLMISDWEMPETSGPELCRRIRQRNFGSYIYIILLTSHGGTQKLVEGLNAGADDFITKPFHPEELLVRIRVGERILSLEGRDLVIFSLAKLADSRDPETGVHLERVREYCRILAEQLSEHPKYQGRIDGDYIQTIYLTSPLHDIGKVGVPDEILLKPGRLLPEEFNVMKRHTEVGYATLDAAARVHPEARYLRMARDIAGSHHERYDGTGYPRGLAGEEIPLCGRIVAVADVYDALTSRRVYKPAYGHETAKSIIVDGRGSHFDPDIVDAFLVREEEFITVQQRFTSDDLPRADEPEADSVLIAAAGPAY